jgi:hypothetical protein
VRGRAEHADSEDCVGSIQVHLIAGAAANIIPEPALRWSWRGDGKRALAAKRGAAFARFGRDRALRRQITAKELRSLTSLCRAVSFGAENNSTGDGAKG